MKDLFFICLILSATLLSCKKVILGEGTTRAKGQVVDLWSGEPIPDAWVELMAQKNGSWYGAGVIDSFTTDEEGKFDFTFEAERGIDYSVRGSYDELYNNYSHFEVDLKDGWSNKNLKLELHPWAWIKINYINVPPIDTVYSLSCNSFHNYVPGIDWVYKDTFQFGYTLSNIENRLVIFIRRTYFTERIIKEVYLTPLDTVEITIEY